MDTQAMHLIIPLLELTLEFLLDFSFKHVDSFTVLLSFNHNVNCEVLRAFCLKIESCAQIIIKLILYNKYTYRS